MSSIDTPAPDATPSAPPLLDLFFHGASGVPSAIFQSFSSQGMDNDQLRSLSLSITGNPQHPSASLVQPQATESAGPSSNVDVGQRVLGSTERASPQQGVPDGDPEFVRITKWLDSNVPFLILLGFVFLHDHIMGIALFLWLHSLLSRVSKRVTELFNLQNVRNPSSCWTFSATVFTLVILSYVLFPDGMWYPLIFHVFAPGDPIVSSIWDVLFLVSLNDLLVRFSSCAFKALLLQLSAFEKLEHRQQGLWLAVCEQVTLVYRTVIPTLPWIAYLLSIDTAVFASLTAAVYCVFKLRLLGTICLNLFHQVRAARKSSSPFGQTASEEECMEAGNCCSICQEPYSAPIRLVCGHIFDESCVEAWCRRSNTCPLCRHEIEIYDSRHADGSSSLRLVLF